MGLDVFIHMCLYVGLEGCIQVCTGGFRRVYSDVCTGGFRGLYLGVYRWV